MKEIPKSRLYAIRRRILDFYRKHGRTLPFRETTDPYCITVSEIMLQQTQVERVVERYKMWVDRWPNWASLAQTDRRAVLSAWSGLGYNRRALYLRDMAGVIVNDYGGNMPTSPEELKKLPGIGDYTAHAIAIFAFNAPLVTIDTNIRKVLIHELDLPHDTSPEHLREYARLLLPRGKSREWHNALMDYARMAIRREAGAIKPVSTQSRFEGSRRQIRGEIVRRLTDRTRISIAVLARDMERDEDDIRTAALSLETEGLVKVSDKTIRLIAD